MISIFGAGFDIVAVVVVVVVVITVGESSFCVGVVRVLVMVVVMEMVQPSLIAAAFAVASMRVNNSFAVASYTQGRSATTRP